MYTNKSILSYSLRPTVTTQGTTALTGIINGMRAFVPGCETVAQFEQLVKEDNLVVAKVTEGGQERTNAKGEKFTSQASIVWVRKAAQPTATEVLVMQSLIEKALTREKTERVDTVAQLTQNVKSRIEAMREKAAQEELAKQTAGGANIEPVLADA